MIFLLCGSDIDRSHDEFNNLVARFIKKEKNLSIIQLGEENFSKESFGVFLRRENLFGGRNLFCCRRLLEMQADYFLENIGKIFLSPDTFIFWEKEPVGNWETIFKKGKAEVREFEVRGSKNSVSAKKKGGDFLIADLVASRQKEKAWLFYRREILAGVLAEDFFWKIFWQIKTLLLIKKGEIKGIHSFVLKKGTRASFLFEQSELESYLAELTGLYHQSRQGLKDFTVGLEKIILKL